MITIDATIQERIDTFVRELHELVTQSLHASIREAIGADATKWTSCGESLE